MIRTGQLLADIAQPLGYQLVEIDLFRSRLATATRKQLRTSKERAMVMGQIVNQIGTGRKRAEAMKVLNKLEASQEQMYALLEIMMISFP
ncbi:MAG: hypothetical protein ACRD9S_03425 [Pyrinomonadaceae bacterium]